MYQTLVLQASRLEPGTSLPPARILFFLANPTLTVLVQTTADVGPAYLQHAKRWLENTACLVVVAFMKQGGRRAEREEFGR